MGQVRVLSTELVTQTVSGSGGGPEQGSASVPAPTEPQPGLAPAIPVLSLPMGLPRRPLQAAGGLPEGVPVPSRLHTFSLTNAQMAPARRANTTTAAAKPSQTRASAVARHRA
uniref:Uncharacterized protein n=1 Tax=Eutreptiella gymnastica TaxID=73025 RepID=A0A7S4LA17_9EUGL